MKFAKQLKRHQERLGYTDVQMGAALTVGESTYRAWRNGDPKRMPLPIAQEGALARLEKIAAADDRQLTERVAQ